MEDGASEISDWEVLSATSASGGDDGGDFVVLVSGEEGGGGVLHDHFALAPSDAGEGSWSGSLSDDEGKGEGLELVDGLDWAPERRLDLVDGDGSDQVQLGGADEATGESSVLGATAVPCGDALSSDERRGEVEQPGLEKDSARSFGELEFAPQAAHHGTGVNFDPDAGVVADVSQLEESPNNSIAQLEDGGVDAAGGSSLSEAAAAIGGATVTDEEEPAQGKGGNAAPGCDGPDGDAKDGSLPLAQSPGTSEGEKQVAVWWRLPIRLLQCCAWKVKPIWSFSIAAALLGLVVLGRRMYRMRRQARGLPRIKIAFDDKKASQFADRAARLNEAFFMARRVPMLRTSSGAVVPWSMVQER